MDNQEVIPQVICDDITQVNPKSDAIKPSDAKLSVTRSSTLQEIAAEEDSEISQATTARSSSFPKNGKESVSCSLKTTLSSFFGKLRCFGKKQKPYTLSNTNQNRGRDSGMITSGLLPENNRVTQTTKPDERKITLVLDLDETLIHTTCSKGPTECDFSVKVNRIGGAGQYTAYVKKRPGVDDFLREVSKHFEVIIFTASRSNYAGPVIARLEEDAGVTFSQRFYRESCTYLDEIYYKDLTKLGCSLRDAILVDNSPQAAGLQPANYVPVTSWYDSKRDNELKLLRENLVLFYQYPDVRECLKSVLNPWRFVQQKGIAINHVASRI